MSGSPSLKATTFDFQVDRGGRVQIAIARVGTGEIPVRNGLEAAALLKVLVDVARLEAGDATSHVLTANLSSEDAVARVVALQEAARATLVSTSALRTPNDELAK